MVGLTHRLAGGPGLRQLSVLTVALVPWSWFVLRDGPPVVEWVAILLPLPVGIGAATLLLLGVLTRSPWLLLAASSWVLFGLVAVLIPWAPSNSPGAPAPLTLLSANVLADNPRSGELSAALLRADADLLVVNELDDRQKAVQVALSRHYPYSWVAPPEDGVAVYSRWPLLGGELPGRLAEAGARGGRVEVTAGRERFVLYAVHLYRPSRNAYLTEVTVQQQRSLVHRLDQLLDAERLPAVLAGDLNLTDRGTGYRRLAEGRRDALRSTWAEPTSLRLRNRLLLLRIDHLLLPGNWCAEQGRRVTLPGSDHLGVSAAVGPCR